MRSPGEGLGVALAAAVLLGSASPSPAQAPPPPRYVILVTFDGVRPTDFFGGMDSTVAAFADSSGIQDSARTWQEFWRPTVAARRRALMPFFWDSLAPLGMVLGDPASGGRASTANEEGFSAPGYLEMLTGEAQPTVTSNDPVRYPFRTVLQYARHTLHLGTGQVATFASWENFRSYVASRDGDVFVNAGYDGIPEPFVTPELDRLVTLQSRALPAWEESRLDAFTGELALEYLKRHHPRVLFVSFNDTDDYAHLRRYDRVLSALHANDLFLRDLWHAVQASPRYRNRTTLIITTDHGRGRTGATWPHHGRDTPGSREIWMAIIGPFTPNGGGAGLDVTQSQVAATLLACLGLDPAGFSGTAAPPVPGACHP
ncbi:MAG TPA: alkaline phosphatase family protein [Gemmatimonadales bacterium]|nr:alkaline phosphatase family protein [Gemmatimonadales bacterium]